MSSAKIDGPIRDTDVPDSPDIAVGALLGAGDVDRLAALCHALIEELADVSVRLAKLEAAQTGDEGPDNLASVQALTGTMIERVLG